MAASEIYDFVSLATPDVNQTLVLEAQGTLVEEGNKNQNIHMADDGSEERITINTGSIFYISYGVEMLTEADSGTLFDFYHDPAKANGMGSSFKLTALDGHTYVVRFDGALPRARKRSWYSISTIRLRVLGKIADA
jgi:hypothetical protein